ncbi:hypothetical protein K491DRAFT_712855 [Lophiostoma macrostomum CBS 122681]|uniref:GED domain-containing protein n=1 Tax=Lophiostoma macrostomum CBS 122681 TaxID=1314788 RepID=A0A6A6TIT5_9PLEO|nr:hypothetical protein K491DRAFT_712855 [Lophiostoma macrostomum CBS 122681]
MLGLMFKSQSRKWKAIAQVHLDLVWRAVDYFMVFALQHSIPEHDVRERLVEHIIQPRLLTLRKSVDAKLEEIIDCHGGVNTGLMDAYQDTRNHRLQQTSPLASTSLDAWGSTSLRKPDGPKAGAKFIQQLIRLVFDPKGFVSDVLSSCWSSSNAHSPTTPQGTHDSALRKHDASILVRDSEAFYESNLQFFIGAIFGLVVEKGLMERLPDELFTQRIVRHMSKATLKLVAGETEGTARKRIECDEELKGLEECLNKLTTGGRI